MNSYSWFRLGGGLVCALILGASARALAIAPTAEEFGLLQQWVASSFENAAKDSPLELGLNVIANHGDVQTNARAGQPLHIAGKTYTHGFYCHAFSQILVKLPSPGATFTAVAGVDSNDQTSGGRGSIEMSVIVAGQNKFSSGVIHEGASAAVNVNLEGATEFFLQIDPTPDGIACDQGDWADAKVKLQDGRELWLADLAMRHGIVRASYPAEPPFSFQVDGKSSAAWFSHAECKRSSKDLDANRKAWSLVWTSAETGLQARLEGIEYRDHPVVEWAVYLKNTGQTESPMLSQIEALDARVYNFSGDDAVLHHNRGDDCNPQSYEPLEDILTKGTSRTFAPAGGRACSVRFPYFNVAWPNQGMMVAVGWPAQWSATFARDAANVLRMTAGQELTHLRLHPGEEIRTPLIALFFWKGDRVRAQNLWRHWMMDHNLPRTSDHQLPPPILSSCAGGYFPSIQTTEVGEKLFIDKFAEEKVGLTYWWLDAGWYPGNGEWPRVGTWEPDQARYPNGLRAVADEAHKNGMKFIVWFEPERVVKDTWLWQNHPEWIIGKEKGNSLFNLGDPAARSWLTEHVDKMLISQGIDLYRQDFNIDPLSYWRENDAPDRQGISEIRHVEGVLAFWDELRRRHPDLLIDTCASGGRRIDLETLRRAIPLLRSDYQSFAGDTSYAAGNQGHTYGIASWIPYFGQGSYFNPVNFAYNARSYFTPAWAICADARRNDVDWAQVRALAENWRRIAPSFSGDYYPLTPYTLDLTQWIGWQFDQSKTGEGMIQVFRRQNSVYESVRLKLRGLDDKARYEIEDLDRKEKKVMTGSELLEKGLSVVIGEQPGSALIVYRKL